MENEKIIISNLRALNGYINQKLQAKLEIELEAAITELKMVGNQYKYLERILAITKPVQKDWNKNIIEIENYFKSIEIPKQAVKLNKCTTITNCDMFIDSHIKTVKANNGKETFLPYLDRLKDLSQLFKEFNEHPVQKPK